MKNKTVEEKEEKLKLRPTLDGEVHYPSSTTEFEEAWYSKGVVLHNIGEYNEAMKYFDKALELKPEEVDTWYNKGVVYSNLNRYDDGILCFEKAIRFAEEKGNVEEAELIKNNLNLLKVKRILGKRRT